MTEAATSCALCSGVVAILLLVILLPLSFSYLAPWEYGLRQRKSTSKVRTDRIYTGGRYLNGPDMKFFTYKADAHHVKLDNVAIFSQGGEDSIGLSFQIDVDFTYFLIKDKIGETHKDLARTYESVVQSRANDAIKNSATSVPFEDYFKNREEVEETFREAVTSRWNEPPILHVSLDQFHVGRIKIPESVVEKQLQAKLQIETNDKEKFLQEAKVEREKTAVKVNEVNLKRNKLLLETEAEASKTRAKAIADAELIKTSAFNNGLVTLLSEVGIDQQPDKIAYGYIRALQNRQNVDLTVTHLSDDNVLRTVSN